LERELNMSLNKPSFTASCTVVEEDTFSGSNNMYSGGYAVHTKTTSVTDYVCLSIDDALALAADILANAIGHDRDHLIHDMCKAMAADTRPQTKAPEQGYAALTAQAQLIYQHMKKAGSISAREAMDDHGITANSLTRRITDILQAGFAVVRTRRRHPLTDKLYTRYSLGNAQ
jgi:hypothetical protein